MKILLVEDTPDLRAVCARVLTGAGHAVHAEPSGEAALPRLAETWDIILSDISMPGTVDGIELLRRARAVSPADFIIMTAYPNLDTAVNALREGAYDYLMKPFTPDTLRAAVNRAAEKRRLSAELGVEKRLREELESANRELEKSRRVRESFGQFITAEVADYVLDHAEDVFLRGEVRDVSVFFADVRGFTSYAHEVGPAEVVGGLNEIFLRVIASVDQEGGILNKFLGDGVLALFGAPVPNPDHARAAARAALRARAAVEALAESRRACGLKPLRIGIGLNSGKVVAGCLGSRSRAEYSVIGDAVNLAARLEKHAEPGRILVGPDTARCLAADFSLREREGFTPKGMAESVSVWELLGERAEGLAGPPASA